MPDLKTTQETVRSSIDGSELVRLATTGANWQASLSNIFTALGGSTFPPIKDSTVDYQSVNNGFSYTIPNGDWHLVLIGSSSLVEGTVTMPAAPTNGQVVSVRTTSSVAPFFVMPNTGQSVINGPVLMGVGCGFDAVYRASNTTWYCQEAPVAPFAGGNLTFYVATTGSDSNPGTASAPFASLQHAVNVAAEFDYQELYTATINVADGTYNVTNICQFPIFLNVSGINGVVILGNDATPANVVINSSGPGWINTVSSNFFYVTGFKFNKGFFFTGGELLYGNFVFTGGGSDTLFDFVGSSRIDEFTAPTITFTNAAIFSLAIVHFYVNATIDNTHFVFPAAFSLNNDLVDLENFCVLSWTSNTFTNAAGVTGYGLFAVRNCNVVSSNGVLSDFPGYLSGTLIDNSCHIAVGNLSFPAVVIESSPLTASAILPDTIFIYRDSVGGRSYFLLSNNGVTNQLELPVPARVATQFDKSNTTLADVTGLTMKVAAGQTYRFKACLHVTPDAVGGHKYAIAGTCTATSIIYQINSINNSTNAAILNSRQTALGGAAGVVGGTIDYTEIIGTITVNAGGTLTVQFAQQAANGTSSVLVGSTFEVTDFTV